ncbi:phage tail protein [Nonomuraea sp. PA05]|uniref:phage tail protein n=1 Tax=Nonomuraea sp. PA05 TaxID=2604466 RepID=UPI0011D40132|nr:phage tail protein [Nonomuraea sp. PA05]TYB64793.1 phage tail protein [Nonomuraea sp. PA05]
MPERPDRRPYGAFRFKVEFAASTVGGGRAFDGHCSDVSGLGSEINYSDYREGEDKYNTVRKIPNTYKVDEVTLKRGLYGSTDLFEWFKEVRDGKYMPRSVTITLNDEANAQASIFTLINAQPKKWVGPTLVAKGGGEVAMEELHLVAERIEFRP